MTPSNNDVADHSPSLESLELLGYFRDDARPTFIIETFASVSEAFSRSQLVFSNKALRNIPTLLSSVEKALDESSANADIDEEALKFLSWLRSRLAHVTALFSGVLWSATSLHQRWIVVSGLPQSMPKYSARHEKLSTHGRDEIEDPEALRCSMCSEIGRTLCDTAGLLLRDGINSRDRSPRDLAQAFGVKDSPHNLLVLGFDWATTPLGPIGSWPQVLRHLLPYMLNGLQPGIITWGPERTMIYNEAYVSLIKGLHPVALGASAMIAFGAFWDEKLESEWRAVEQHGAFRYENSQIYMDRSGFLEETYFTYSLTPLLDADGHCCGVDNR